MQFDIITIFPKIFDSYFGESILARAQKKGKIKIKTWNLRDFAKVALRKTQGDLPLRRQIDDRPFGGGAGMVLQAIPIIRAVESLVKPSNHKSQITNHKQISNSKFQKSKTKIVILSAAGKQFTQKMAQDWAKKYKQIILISGRYEGIDERVKTILRAEEISIGPYVLTGGEVPAMAVVDAVARHIPEILGKSESIEETHGGPGIPMYTRPEVIKHEGKSYRVPKVLLSGDHKKIALWRAKHRK